MRWATRVKASMVELGSKQLGPVDASEVEWRVCEDDAIHSCLATAVRISSRGVVRSVLVTGSLPLGPSANPLFGCLAAG